MATPRNPEYEATAAQARGDLVGAIEWARRAVTLHPTSATAKLMLAVMCEVSGDVVEAVQTCRDAVGDEPQLAAAHFALARLLIRSEDYHGAVTAFQAAIALGQGFEADAHWLMATPLHRLGRVADARASLRRAIELDPSHEQARLELAESNQLGGDQPCQES